LARSRSGPTMKLVQLATNMAATRHGISLKCLTCVLPQVDENGPELV